MHFTAKDVCEEHVCMGRFVWICMCFCAEPCSSCEATCRNPECQLVVFKNHGFYTSYQWFCTTYLCLLLMKSLNMSLCFLLSLHGVFNVLACINVSSPPHRLLIYESYPGLSLLPPEESTDVECVTWRIASHPQKSWIFFWQPVASSFSDLDKDIGR